MVILKGPDVDKINESLKPPLKLITAPASAALIYPASSKHTSIKYRFIYFIISYIK